MTTLPRLTPYTPFTDSTGKLTRQAALYVEQLVEAIESALNNLQTQETAQASLLQQLQAVQQQEGAQLQLINQALQAAQNPSTASNTQTQASYVTLTGTGWVMGPTVTFQNASASQNVTTTSRATTPGQTSGAAVMQGNARLQRIVGGVETTLATTTFTITPPQGGDPAYITFNAFGPLSPNTDSTTGEVQYRMDLQRVSGCTSTNIGVTTSVTRN